MERKIIEGCVYCDGQDDTLHLCCRRHARLVCASCEETRAFLLEHEPAQAA